MAVGTAGEYWTRIKNGIMYLRMGRGGRAFHKAAARPAHRGNTAGTAGAALQSDADFDGKRGAARRVLKKRERPAGPRASRGSGSASRAAPGGAAEGGPQDGLPRGRPVGRWAGSAP